ncbi:MAG TPA: protein-glutamate O-methyltransferase CheR [Candidatus Solibacter sp.]|nr:protein-glutamate O-methyltransferase CheR [Candidatus Solibacter sp.]
MIRAPEIVESAAVESLAPQEFEQIRELAYRTFGLDLKPGKEELVSARLGRLVRGGGFRSFQDYYRHVLGEPSGQALVAMVDALATNHTSFLREPDHFDFLCKELAPGLSKRESVDIWCAACSTGEEVWTLAFVLNEVLGSGKVHITASDISTKVLSFAEKAVYALNRCQNLPGAWLARYFAAQGHPASAYRVVAPIRAQVAFRRINLIHPIARRRQFPVIFCRNVMIYFDRQVQQRVVSQLVECLEPGGHLFVGHAESLARVSHGLEFVRPAVYRKPGKREKKWSK